jgi:hypothetical protein
MQHGLTEEAYRRVFWPKVVLIGSRRFYNQMTALYERFAENSIDVLLPWAFFCSEEDPRRYEIAPEIGERFNEEAHLLRIKSADIAYIINQEGYIGTNSAFDIGFAVGSRISVYSTEPTENSSIITNGVKTLEEIISLAKEIYEKKYKPRVTEFEMGVKS